MAQLGKMAKWISCLSPDPQLPEKVEGSSKIRQDWTSAMEEKFSLTFPKGN